MLKRALHWIKKDYPQKGLVFNLQHWRSTKCDNEEQNLKTNPAKGLILWYAVQLKMNSIPIVSKRYYPL